MMDAEGEMDAGGDDQAAAAAPLQAKGDDGCLKGVIGAEFAEGRDRWDVNPPRRVVGLSDSAVAVELNAQGGVSISTGDYSHIEDHEMDVVLMNGSIDDTSAAAQGFVNEGSNLPKEASELGALGRYVMECSPGRDEFVVNEVDCLKNEHLEVFEADNEFGFEARADSESADFEHFVRAEEAYEAAHAPGSIDEGEGLQFQQLLADSEVEDNPDLSQYNDVDLPEAAASSRVSLEPDESLFYGQVFEGPGRENTAHLSMELEKGLHCRQVVGRNQVVCTSDYVVDADGGPHYETGNYSQSLLCDMEGAGAPKFEEAVAAHGEGMPASPVPDEPKPDLVINTADDMVSLCQEVAMISEPDENFDHRVTSQEQVGAGGEAADTLDRVVVCPEYAPGERRVDMSLASAEVEGVLQADRDFSGDSSHRAGTVEEAMVHEAETYRRANCHGDNDVPQGTYLIGNPDNSVDSEGRSKDAEIVEQFAKYRHYTDGETCCEVYSPLDTEHPDNRYPGTASEAEKGQVLTQGYDESMSSHDQSAPLDLEACESSGMDMDQAEVMRVDESSAALLAAGNEHELVAMVTESLNSDVGYDERIGEDIVEHVSEVSDLIVPAYGEPRSETCHVEVGGEGILPDRVQTSKSFESQIIESSDGSGLNAKGNGREESSKEVASKGGVYNRVSEDVQHLDSSSQIVEGTRGGPVTDSSVQSNEVLRSHEQGAMLMVEDKVLPSKMELEQVEASGSIKNLPIQLRTSEVASGVHQIKPSAEIAEPSGNRKARDDSKSKSPQPEAVGVPLWVKWRGKWQPGIQCCTIDCPPATLKAKPSYSKKHYIVVYSPTARNYSWVDIQHTCSISEDPVPLFSGTHESGRDTVKDVFITRKRMLLKLGGEMLDISDRLHVKAVVESSRNVNVWKSFATEAAAATTYAQLGTLLVSLHLAIVREYIKPTWMMKRHGLWKEECVRAESAATVQKLTKELINAVLWDDVGPLWNEPDQPELDPQWSNWKGEAFEEKEEPDTDTDPKSAGPCEKDAGQGKNSSAGSSKRFKEQARARRQRPHSSEGLESTPQKRSKHNPRSSEGGTVGRAITAFRSPLVHPTGLLQNQPCVPVLEADRCHEVISGDTLANLNGQLALTITEANTEPLASGDLSLQVAGSSAGYFSDSSEGDESKVFERIGKSAAASMAEGLIALESGLCSAYLKNKGRRCNRFSKKEGVKYCDKHIYLIDPESVGKKVAIEGNIAWQSGLCSAFLRRENRRCARQAKEGFNGYCGFHVHLGTTVSDRNGDDADSLQREDGGGGNSVFSSVKEDRCQGITTRGVQCTHRTKDGSLFCVKHSLKGATQTEKDESKGQTSGASKMDWQKGTEPAVSVGTQGQADHIDAQHEVASEPGSQEGGIVRTLELKSFEHSRGSGEGSTRKRKALSSFFTDRAVGDTKSSATPSQEALSPKFTDGRANQWTQCKGRTTRNEEQCSFRAREGHEYCSKHLNAMEAKKKIILQRKKDEANNTETKGSSSVPGARNLFHRFLKGAGSVCSQGSSVEAGNQLVLSTRLEAAKDGTAEELIKLVTVEMTKLQMFLDPVDISEGKKSDGNSGPVFVASSSSQPLRNVLDGPVLDRQPSILAGVLADDRILDDMPLTCGLCDAEFPAVSDLGRHWQLVHKKEISLFVKGHACRVCDRLYTRKQTVMTHWKKRHQSIEMNNPDLSVCFACDLRFNEDDDLLNHVISGHPYQLSSPSLKEMIAQNRAIIGAEQEGTESLKCPDCLEEFDTHLGLYQHRERFHNPLELEGNGVKFSHLGDFKPGESNEFGAHSNGKYVCRLCGMNFPMLPDLGRHHQAAHMLCTKVEKPVPPRGNLSSKKEAASESGRMKLPIRRKAEDKSAASEPSFGPARRKRKKLRFTPGSKKSLEKDTKGPDSLRLHVQAVLQGATLRKRHKKQLGEFSLDPIGKDLSSLTKVDFTLPRDSVSNSNSSSPNDIGFSLTRTTPNTLSLTKRVETNFESVQEKFKLQADKIFTDFSQLHGETSVKHESLGDGPLYSNDSGKPSLSKLSIKQDHDLEVLKDIKTERSKLPLISSTSSQERLTFSDNSKKRPKFIVTCEDLSGGQEPVPIVCVIDHDVLVQIRGFTNKESSGKNVYQPSTFTYITKRRLDPSLGLVPENYKIGCNCGKAQCTPDACEHVNLFDCDNAEACDIYAKPMRGRFPYDDQGCIILEEGYLVYECNSSCPCQQTCHNRVLQKGVTVKLEVFKTHYKGWAVRAAQKIIRGTFVCEYIGEVLHDQEANKRGERYDQVGCSYLYDIDAHLDISGTGRRSKPFVIDATSQGNVARFINHSCAPNLVNYQVLVESMDAQLAHIGLFASRDIEIGEELAYDYRYRLLPGKGCPCHCGAKNCRGRLY
ncbi:protein MpSUVR2 [Marchantia polymorpha subsp. ruderalis]|uniref:C2H2-type domain-containing protein n=2 Tax=Marchantia polymorpha TaxID=3197 RepID=A0AAF6BYL3_MARPO|nr:hypothetical protein MARPO_0003s0206 [Marchantia polymorpha]BBN17097.1 hypothetical protein Mp_7g11940 [Marchantia polymorpha subsp. ruderalis]|eukprot:PTQ49333.1 hypothetical protein MARPO_0003s0206 [Marchantia polymorpha]